MSERPSADIYSTFLRLRSDVSIEPLPVDETFWPRLSSGALGSFHGEYLVSAYRSDADWSMWEMHPNGDEIVVLLEGDVTFTLESDGTTRSIRLDRSGTFVLVPKGAWHTADVNECARMLFVTAGEGTRHRPRDGRG